MSDHYQTKYTALFYVYINDVMCLLRQHLSSKTYLTTANNDSKRKGVYFFKSCFISRDSDCLSREKENCFSFSNIYKMSVWSMCTQDAENR
jgi:hypothetical protein